jgi:apolipoprotein N-acyltransferase
MNVSLGEAGRGSARTAMPRPFDGLRGDLLVVVTGALLPLAFAPFGWHLFAPLGLTVLLLSWNRATPALAARRGFLFGAAGFLAGTYWLYISLHDFGEAPLFIAIPLMVGLVLVMAAWFAFAGWLLVRLFPRPGPWRWLGGAPSVWALVEWLRSWVATGFPWFAYGYSQVDSSLVGYAPVLGVFGVSWVVALVAGGLCQCVSGPRLPGLALIAVAYTGGAILDRVHWTTPVGSPVDVAVVQGGISQDLKWDPEQFPKTKALYRELTARHWDADMIVWPEAAIPALLREYRDYLTELLLEAERSDTVFLFGTLQARGRRPDRRYYNSVIGYDGEAVAEYNKHHLVPFGEYYPVPGFVRRWMKTLNLPYADISAGEAGQGPLALGGLQIGVSICYEDVFGAELLGAMPEATMLVNVSNDAWFGGSVAPYQHQQIARMRAIEVARPLVRATNSGISAVIDYDGALRRQTGLFEAVVMRERIQPRRGSTPYSRYGDTPLLLLAGLITVLGTVAARRWA